MAGNKKPNLWYVAILGVAGAGLAFDKFVLSAQAGSETVGTEDRAVDEKSIAAPQSAVIHNEPLGERFEEAQLLLKAPAFRRLDGFSKPTAAFESQTTSDSKSPGGGFASRHKLTAVLSQPSGDLAVVDGLLLRIGESVEGLRLTKIENDGVIFEIDGKIIRLPLARPGLDR